MPKVSIIMNVRNGTAFLREALDSVMAQTFQDWELIVWDDCSTDGSATIVAEYRDPRLRYYLSPEDIPLGPARDKAIRHATGDWLAFLDQDDVWLPHKLEQQIALSDAQVGIIYGRALVSYPDGRERDYDYAHEFEPLPEGDIFTRLFADACFIAMSSALLLRAAVDETGGIPKVIETVPDYYLYLAIARHYQARAVQGVVCRYRVHPGSMSQSNRKKLYSEPLWLLERWKSHLDPRVFSYRRMTYSTALAWEEMHTQETAAAGLWRLLSKGSVTWLMGRPFVHAWRALRRKIRRPHWQALQL